MMQDLLQDLHYGIRVMAKKPGFTIVALLTLIVGIGANTAIFSIINAVLLRPLPYHDPDRVVVISEKSQQLDALSVSYPNFLDWRDQNQAFEEIAAFRPQDYSLAGIAEPERIRGWQVSSNFFSCLGVTMTRGRSFTPQEDALGASPVAILSYGLWQRKFGASESILGSALPLDGQSFTIIGILPAGFSFYDQGDLYTTIGSWDDDAMRARDLHPGIRVVGRLKSGTSIEQARLSMEIIAKGLAEKYPDTNTGNGALVIPIHQDVVGNVRPILLILLGAVGFVLLITCANIANLLLAQAVIRQREVSIRAALGASRGRIIRQFITESILLAGIGGGLGLLLAYFGTESLVAITPQEIARVKDVKVDVYVLGFTLLLSVLTGIVFGLLPAIQASKFNLIDALKGGAYGSSANRQRVRSLFIVCQIALALVLLIGAGLMVKTILQLRNVDAGFDTRNVLASQLSLTSARYAEPAQKRVFYQQMLEQVKNSAEIQSVALVINLPLADDIEAPFWISDRPRPGSGEMPWALFYATSPDYLKAMGIALLNGRYFNEQDTEKSPDVVVVDETLANNFFPNENPIGKRLSIETLGGAREIIGVVRHVRHFGLDADEKAKVHFQIYIPYVQIPDQIFNLAAGTVSVVARTNSNPIRVAPAIQRQVSAMDAGQILYNVRTMEQMISNSISERNFLMQLLGIFAALALVLAAVGIYGVMSYMVSYRTREIGIRMALGAQKIDVLKMVLGHGLKLSLTGIAIGLVAAFLLTRVMETILYKVSATDSAVFVLISLLLVGVTLLAGFVPARKATKIDPLIALRFE
ncbi:MAG TPA: ABC transporter permease [Blastocatellia bacterium]|jgi:predicted permease|nr:ABC transporter permease [Blastocatellia bacterium]